MAESNDILAVGASFVDNLSCKICFEVLHDPVQCENNEHYFCRECITQCLCNSETCPVCMEHLTLETLRQAPRIVLEFVSQVKKPRCSYAVRGCKEDVKVEEVLLHQQTCAFAPVPCSNEGCEETVNRRDKESHETAQCKFRMMKCESCSEEMVYSDYEKHQCTLRKEMNEMKVCLTEMAETLNQLVRSRDELHEKLKAHDQSIRDIQDPLRHASSAAIQRDSAVINGHIFIFSDQSLEVFNWSTRAWTLVQNCLLFRSRRSFSFLYGKKIMVCGGSQSDRIEFLDPSENGFASTVFPGNLPFRGLNGILCGNRIITFGKDIGETSLERPWKSLVLVEGEIQVVSFRQPQLNSRSACALECFGKDIFVIGFSGTRIERYDTVSNELTTLAILPYAMYNMATVAYKDNIIILGGENRSDNVLVYVPSDAVSASNDVFMFNIHTLECKRLPSMLEKRGHCTAVIMGDVIVVMGGRKGTRGGFLNTVEYYVFGHEKWQELPAMNLARALATSCVYV